MCRYPEYDRALILLPRGGADATAVRELGLVNRTFVEDKPFYFSGAKSDVCWLNHDEVLVSSDFGPESLTDLGCPRQVRKWRRDMPSSSADVIFLSHSNDVAVGDWFDTVEGFERLFVERAHDFYNSQRLVAVERPGKLAAQQNENFSLQILEVPQDCRMGVHRQWLVLMPCTEFDGIPTGDVTIMELDKWLVGLHEVEVIFIPDAHTSFQQPVWTRNFLVSALLEDVTTRLVILQEGSWELVEAFGESPAQAAVSVIDTASEHDDEICLVSTSATQPATLWYGQVDGQLTEVRRAPALFNSERLETRQHWATSVDGTWIPYHITGRFGSRAGANAGVGTETTTDAPAPTPAPTPVHVYGGFEVSLVPQYLAIRGLVWLEHGGYSTKTDLRGGGGFGPIWHSSVAKTKRMGVYEDRQAMLCDLVAHGYCTRGQLNVRGGSNGGLPTAVYLTSYPELVGAAVSQVSLADMMRYHRLSAGASQMVEYGNPDIPAKQAAIAQYLPVQRVIRREQRAYPSALTMASTRDDRAHSAHVQSLAWLLREAGQPADYHENTEGGHADTADNSQVAPVEALISTWLRNRLK